jgi:hypothetical protein
MKFDLPKTRELRKKIFAVLDKSNMWSKFRGIEREITEVKDRLEKSESLEEYQSTQNEIFDLKKQQKEIEIELRTQPKREKTVRENEMKLLPDVYNQEFKPYYDKYVKLDKELKKQLQKFAEDIEPITKEMLAIERLERSFYDAKMASSLEEHRKYIKLPIDPRTLDKPSGWLVSRNYGIASGTNTIINQIKKIK